MTAPAAARLRPRVAEGRLRLVRYDQRGHGRSSWGDATDVSVDLLGADLGCLLDTLAPAGPVVLGGHSMGGMTTMCLAAARPELFGERVRGVALVSTSAGDLAPHARSRTDRLRQRLTPGALELALAGARVVESLRRRFPPEHPRHHAFVRDLGDSDRLTPPRHSEHLTRAVPEAALHVVPRTGHMLPQERARLVTDAIERPLDSAR